MQTGSQLLGVQAFNFIANLTQNNTALTSPSLPQPSNPFNSPFVRYLQNLHILAIQYINSGMNRIKEVSKQKEIKQKWLVEQLVKDNKTGNSYLFVAGNDQSKLKSPIV